MSITETKMKILKGLHIKTHFLHCPKLLQLNQYFKLKSPRSRDIIRVRKTK